MGSPFNICCVKLLLMQSKYFLLLHIKRFEASIGNAVFVTELAEFITAAKIWTYLEISGQLISLKCYREEQYNPTLSC